MTSAQYAGLKVALRAIKDHVCVKCGAQAKGFVYREQLPVYYCRHCLRDELSVIQR